MLRHFSTVMSMLAHLIMTVAAEVNSGYLHLEIQKRVLGQDGQLYRRDDPSSSFNAALTQDSNKLEYLINITIGTPPQSMEVTIDTGSSDLWVPATSSKPCQQGNCDGGSYTPSKSSSYKLISQGGFNITYAAPGDSDAGDWASDVITVGSSPFITGQTIGVSLDGYDNHGVMGIGYDTNETPYPGLQGAETYPSAVDQMVQQGLIQRRAYSLYLNEYSANTGAVLFGGIDTTKYTGDLIGLPLQPGLRGNQVDEFFVTITSVSFTDHTGHITQLTPEGYAQSALLDAGTSATLITNDVYEQLAEGLGAVALGYGETVVPCSYSNSNATIGYQFGGADGPVITVPLSQLIGNQIEHGSQFSDPSGGCEFGITGPIGGVVILGDTFLRSAYAVFDLDNNAAALAQAKLGEVSTSKIVVIPSGTALPMVSLTATVVGTQLSGGAAETIFEPTAAPTSGEISAASPTFALGASASGTSGGSGGSASSSGVAGMTTPPPVQAAGLAAALMLVAVAF